MNEHDVAHSLAQSLAQSLSQSPAAADAQPPTEADVILTQTLSRSDLRARARRFVALLQEHDECPHDNRGTSKESDDRTTIHLPEGARATLYPASGALRYVSGMRPADAPFAEDVERAVLQRQLEERAYKLALPDWAGANDALRFERLFRTRAQGADPAGRQSAITLFRAIGAWRQYVGGLPVLGAASVAMRLAGDNRLDALEVNIRPTSGETVDRVRLVEPIVGARQIVQQLASVLGVREVPADIVQSAVLYLGYLDLGKRKAQRVLAPSYVAQIVLRHKQVRQAYVLAVAATEKPYLELPLFGTATAAQPGRPAAHCKENAD
jgi:hypothetical protein